MNHALSGSVNGSTHTSETISRTFACASGGSCPHGYGWILKTILLDNGNHLPILEFEQYPLHLEYRRLHSLHVYNFLCPVFVRDQEVSDVVHCSSFDAIGVGELRRKFEPWMDHHIRHGWITLDNHPVFCFSLGVERVSVEFDFDVTVFGLLVGETVRFRLASGDVFPPARCFGGRPGFLLSSPVFFVMVSSEIRYLPFRTNVGISPLRHRFLTMDHVIPVIAATSFVV